MAGIEESSDEDSIARASIRKSIISDCVPGDFERARMDGRGGIWGIPSGGGEVNSEVAVEAFIGRDGIGGGGPLSSSSILITDALNRSMIQGR